MTLFAVNTGCRDREVCRLKWAWEVPVPITEMGSVFVIPSEYVKNGWKKARKLANLPVRVHDLKHTFGRRLRAASVSFEDRQDLLGHKSARITTHYSSAELLSLWKASNKVCDSHTRPTLTLLRTDAQPSPAKTFTDCLKVGTGSITTCLD